MVLLLLIILLTCCYHSDGFTSFGGRRTAATVLFGSGTPITGNELLQIAESELDHYLHIGRRH